MYNLISVSLKNDGVRPLITVGIEMGIISSAKPCCFKYKLSHGFLCKKQETVESQNGHI